MAIDRPTAFSNDSWRAGIPKLYFPLNVSASTVVYPKTLISEWAGTVTDKSSDDNAAWSWLSSVLLFGETLHDEDWKRLNGDDKMSPTPEETADRSGRAKSLVGVSAMMTINQASHCSSVVFQPLLSFNVICCVACCVSKSKMVGGVLSWAHYLYLPTYDKVKIKIKRNQNPKSNTTERQKVGGKTKNKAGKRSRETSNGGYTACCPLIVCWS